MYNSLIKKLKSDIEYFNNEYKIYRKMIESNNYEGDALDVSFTSDALAAFGRGCEEILKDIKEMKEKENNIVLYIKKYEKVNNKNEPFTYYGTKYRTLLKGAENLGKIEKYFNVYFNCDFNTPRSGHLVVKREFFIKPKFYEETTCQNGQKKLPYITILDYEDFYPDLDED